MREGYVYAFAWANSFLGGLFNHASSAVPELRAHWPTRSHSGYEANAYSLNDTFSLIVIRANGEAIPSIPNMMPVPLPVAGCPSTDPMDVFDVVRWARGAFRLGQFDSVFIAPMVEVPNSQVEFDTLPEPVKRLLLVQIDQEFHRISAILKGLAERVVPPRIVIRTSSVQNIMGDYVAGDKVQGDKVVNDASQRVTTSVVDSSGACVNTAITQAGAASANPDPAALIDRIRELAEAVQKSNLQPFAKSDVKAWIAEAIAELQKPKSEQEPGKLSYVWGKIVGVLKQGQEAYESLKVILTPILSAVAPEFLK